MERLMARKYLFGDFTLHKSRFRLEQGERLLRLEKLPMELLFLLVERRGELVSREDIAEHLWGNDVFLEVDNGINTAIRKLRQALRDDPDKPRYIETVVGKGYRFAASVICSNGGSSPQVEALPSPAHAAAQLLVPSEESQPRTVRPWPFIGITAILVLLIGAAIWYRGRSVKHAAQPAIKSIAVLPLKNLSGDPSQEYLADGMTEALIGRLSGIHDLRVISRTSVVRFKDTKLSVPEIAKTLNVDAIVEGSVMREGNRIRVHAQLIRAATDAHFWSEEYDRELPDVLALESDVAQSIAYKVQVTLTGQERARIVATRQVHAEAYEAYLKGRYYWNKRTIDGLEKGERYFQEAIDKDPSYSAAYSGLADCNSGLTWHGFKPPSEALPKAYAAARKAIEIDPESAEAHASLALVLHHRWDWAAAEAEFKRALELDPQYANAHHWYGDYLSITGRHQEALIEARQALQIDPLNLMIGTWLGLRYYLARDYDRAIEQSRTTVDLDPNFAAAHLLLGESYVQKGLNQKVMTSYGNLRSFRATARCMRLR